MRLDGATVAVGDTASMVVVEDLLRAQIVQYAGASGDFHPYHHDEPHAQAGGFPGVFAHGMLTMGVTGRLLSELVGDEAILPVTIHGKIDSFDPNAPFFYTAESVIVARTPINGTKRNVVR